ncbi:MAG: 3-methyl-2-oxobutanoate dehydrogenase subunit beta [bacterium]
MPSNPLFHPTLLPATHWMPPQQCSQMLGMSQNRTFIQSESELISINAVYGAAHSGARCMTSSSGVGISLMQEGISACFAKRLPIMLINVNRSGFGMLGEGGFAGGHEDYLRETRGGGNGDYRILVFCPATIQEAVDLVYNGFDIAEKYRIPFEIMTEGRLGQMMEDVELPPMLEIPKRPTWGMDGTRKIDDYQRPPTSFFVDQMKAAEENEQRWELYRCEDAETVIVSLGIVSRICRDVVDNLRDEGKKVGMLRVISCWPFPEKGFLELPHTVKRFFCVETNIRGQVIEDVMITCKKIKRFNSTPIFVQHTPTLVSTKILIDMFDKIERNEIEEVSY